jgi:hypothetical protein
MTKQIELATLSLATLAAVYNMLADKPVKKFGDHKIADLRVATILATTKHQLIGEQITGSQLIVDGVYLAPIAAPKAAKAKAAPKAKPVAKAAPKVKGTAAVRWADDMTITVLVEANPKKAGSMASARFALYTSGMTVKAYRDAVVEHDASIGLGRKQGMLDSRNDLDFDSERGYIAVK